MRYILMERSTHYNYILRARKLFQQFLVDMWAIDETENLKWVKNNQKELRAGSYHAVKQAVIANKVEASGAMVVPASFTGGQRWYDRYYQNAMALVRHFDKPTFFITMTLDVNCPEVQQHMMPGMTPYDRADILCRVFQLKKKKLIEMITKEQVLGKAVARIAVIEFQKRGAPHVHILVWIEDFDPTPHNIDNVISAEIPYSPLIEEEENSQRPFTSEQAYQQQEFHDLVMEKMIHGPCGPAYGRTNLGCCRNSLDGTCKRNFPKNTRPFTEPGDGSAYPEYRRRSVDEGGHYGYKWYAGTRYEIDVSVCVLSTVLELCISKTH